MKKLIIIGAGAAGLSAGIYAARSGFDVTIVERHNIPGGLSTAWYRKGYLFEGGMHWLTGTSESLYLNRVWKEIGALKENNPIIIKDPFYTLINKEKKLFFYRNIDRWEKHLLEYAPEDTKAIKSMCFDIRLFLPVHMIVADIPFLKSQKRVCPKFLELMKMAPALLRLEYLKNQSYQNYLSKFRNSDIKHLLSSIIGNRYNALSLVYTLASICSGDCGYPTGGSLRFTQNMAETFKELGGKFLFRTSAEKIKIHGKKTEGLYINNNKFIPADFIIVTQDTFAAIEMLFTPPLSLKKINKLKADTDSEQNMFIGIGVKADLSSLPKTIIFPLKKPFTAGGLEFNELRVNNYAQFPEHSPKNCTSLTCLLLGNSFEYWQHAKADGSYKEKKQKLIKDFIDYLSKFIPQIKGNVEVTDAATPLTYQRYCNTYQGGWMSIWKPKMNSFILSPKFTGIKGLYFAGERTIMPGGLPIAAISGRRAVQYLCRDNKMEFK